MTFSSPGVARGTMAVRIYVPGCLSLTMRLVPSLLYINGLGLGRRPRPWDRIGRGPAFVISMPGRPIPGTSLPRFSSRFRTRSGLLFGSKFRKKCASFVRTMTDPEFLRGLGTSDAAAISVKLASSCSERCIVLERFSAVRRLSKTVVGHKRCSRRRAVCPKRWSFFGRRPTLGITGRI